MREGKKDIKLALKLNALLCYSEIIKTKMEIVDEKKSDDSDIFERPLPSTDFKFAYPPPPSDEDILLYNEYLYRNRFEYILEESTDGINWKFVASFEEGVMSRFNEPFDDQIALKEAKAYKKFKGTRFVRIIIEV